MTLDKETVGAINALNASYRDGQAAERDAIVKYLRAHMSGLSIPELIIDIERGYHHK